MSGVVLTAATAQVTPTARARPVLKALLPGPPTTRREFYPIDTLALYAEVYDNLRTDAAHRRHHDARSPRPARKSQDGGRAQEQGAPGAPRAAAVFGYSAQVPLKDLAPGRYMLQVEAKPRLKDAPTVPPRDALHDRAAAARSRRPAGQAGRCPKPDAGPGDASR